MTAATAAFDAAYAWFAGAPWTAEVEDTPTSEPPSPRSTRCRAAACRQRNAPSRLTDMMARHASRVWSTNGAPPPMPAFANIESTAPKAASVASIAAVTCSGSATSHTNASHRRPVAVTAFTASAFFAGFLAQIATSAPASASDRAMPRPMPPLPPVTTTVRPVRSNWLIDALLIARGRANDNVGRMPPVPERLDGLVARAQREVHEGVLPSCQIAVGLDGEVAFAQTLGNATDDTRYNVFSATKAVIAATMWQLMADRLVDPTDRVAAHFPEFAANGKGEITIEQLMTHTSGFPRAPLGPPTWADR